MTIPKLAYSSSSPFSFEYVFTLIVGTILLTLLVIFSIYFIWVYKTSQTKLHLEKERIKQELLRVENEVREHTLASVSRELHDNYGQMASLIKINLNLVSNQLSKSDQQLIDNSKDLLHRLVDEISSLSSSLKGDNVSKLGWIKMVAMDFDRLNKLGIKQFKLYDKDPLFVHEKSHEVLLYRIIQELVHNTLKYANAKEVTLTLYSVNDRFILNYRDNGIGFDKNLILLGAGLKNIKARCEMIGAHFQLSSSPNNGVDVIIEI